MLVQVDMPVTTINFKAISTLVTLKTSSVKVINQTGILITLLENIMKLILIKIKMTLTINTISNRIIKIMIKTSSITRTKATTKTNSRITISNLLNRVKPTKDRKKQNKMISPNQKIELLQWFQVTKLVVKWEMT